MCKFCCCTIVPRRSHSATTSAAQYGGSSSVTFDRETTNGTATPPPPKPPQHNFGRADVIGLARNNKERSPPVGCVYRHIPVSSRDRDWVFNT